MVNLTGPSVTKQQVSSQRPAAEEVTSFSVPSFYITGRQPLSPAAILLAVLAAVGAVLVVLFVLGHTMGHGASGQADPDDPDQIDVIVVGDPGHAPRPARSGAPVSPVHPTIIVHLPRSGEQMGLIPNTPAGHLLFNWLAAFNQSSYPELAKALPNVALASTTAAQMELRRHTGGFNLLSAKEVQPGILVFRLLDQTPSATEVLGFLAVRPNSNPAVIESFSLSTARSSRLDATKAAAPRPPASTH